MEIDKNTTVAFSGHRSFKMANAQRDLFAGSDADMAGHLPKRIIAEIRKFIDKGYDTFLCGMAEGFDLMAGEAVASLKNEYRHIRLIAVIPHPGQAASFGDGLRDTYESVLDAADEAVTICSRYSHDCFHRRNDFLVEHSTALICYYNGSPGGTAYTVRKALKSGSSIVNMA